MSHLPAIVDPSNKVPCPRFVAHGTHTCGLCSMLAYCVTGANGGQTLHWHCTRCGLANELKYCSNCGEERTHGQNQAVA
jgi:hypothetical protein